MLPPIKTLALGLAENRYMETTRLILRPIELSDAKEMYHYASDDEVTKYVFPTHQSLAETTNTIADFFMKQPLGKYVLELKETAQMIGTIDLMLSEAHKKAEIGYTLAKEYWGQGYTKEALDQLLWLAFDVLELNVVSAIHDVDNPNSGKVMQKAGMHLVGTFPNYMIHKGKSVDVMIYVLTKENYKKT